MNEENFIDFHYIKASGYQNHHADGVFGGLTPRGDVHLTFFAERAAIPTRVRQMLDSNGRPGDVLEKDGKQGVVRELECGVSLNIQDAIALRDFLSNIIERRQKS